MLVFLMQMLELTAIISKPVQLFDANPIFNKYCFINNLTQ